MNKRLFLLYIYYYYGKLTYPKQLEEDLVGIFTTLKKAAAYLRQALKKGKIRDLDLNDKEENITIVRFKVMEHNFDAPIRYYSRRFYDENGRYIGREYSWKRKIVFHGRDHTKLRFKRGEFVQFISEYGDNELHAGIISMLPHSVEDAARYDDLLDQSDDTYRIEYSFDKEGHEHLEECQIMKLKGKISEKLRNSLMKRYRRINRRMKKHFKEMKIPWSDWEVK
jgi:hypothetical protein